MLLQRMLDMLGDAADADVLARSDEIHLRLQRMAADLPQVQGLFVHGADSRSLANSRVHPPPRHIDYSDREWYQAHRSGGVAVYVTQALVSRSTGEPAFDMSRRRTLDDGSMAGSVHVSLRPKYLTDFYRELAATTPGLRTFVMRTDGSVLARWPESSGDASEVRADTPLMRKVAAGAISGDDEGASPFDGVDRLRSFRSLVKYPVVVVTGIDRGIVHRRMAAPLPAAGVVRVPDHVRFRLDGLAGAGAHSGGTRRAAAARRRAGAPAACRIGTDAVAEARGDGAPDRRRGARLQQPVDGGQQQPVPAPPHAARSGRQRAAGRDRARRGLRGQADAPVAGICPQAGPAARAHRSAGAAARPAGPAAAVARLVDRAVVRSLGRYRRRSRSTPPSSNWR